MKILVHPQNRVGRQNLDGGRAGSRAVSRRSVDGQRLASGWHSIGQGSGVRWKRFGGAVGGRWELHGDLMEGRWSTHAAAMERRWGSDGVRLGFWREKCVLGRFRGPAALSGPDFGDRGGAGRGPRFSAVVTRRLGEAGLCLECGTCRVHPSAPGRGANGAAAPATRGRMPAPVIPTRARRTGPPGWR